MNRLTCIFLLLFASTSFGQVTMESAKTKVVTGIKSPVVIGESVLIGEDSKPVISDAALITVKTEFKSVSIKAFYAKDSNIQVIVLDKLEGNKWLLAKPGKFVVIATAFDAVQGVAESSLQVTIGDTTKPDDPNPPPTSDFADIEATSRSASLAMNDPDTASRLATVLMSMSKQVGSSDSVQSAQALVVIEIEKTLATRTGQSLLKDWKNGWRLPMNVAIEKAKVAGKVPSPKQYALVVEAMARGLGAK